MLNTIKNLKSRWGNDLIILFFCLFMIWAHKSSFETSAGLFDWNDGPYKEYYSNRTIILLNDLSLGVDIGLSTLIFLKTTKMFFKSKDFCCRDSIILLLISGIFLIWYELYYGSTIYYGEVRDKQMLPLGVNNFGIMGSTIFLASLFKEKKFKFLNIQCPWTISLLLNTAFSFFLKDQFNF